MNPLRAAIDWIQGYAATVDRLLAPMLGGYDAADAFSIAFVVITLVFAIFVIAAASRRHPVLAIIFLAVPIIALLAFAALSGAPYYQQCDTTRGTVAYQFSDEPEPKAQTTTVRRCRTRRIGAADYDGWQTPKVEMR
jgi:hypothetical protein